MAAKVCMQMLAVCVYVIVHGLGLMSTENYRRHRWEENASFKKLCLRFVAIQQQATWQRPCWAVGLASTLHDGLLGYKAVPTTVMCKACAVDE